MTKTQMARLAQLAHQMVCPHRDAQRGYDWMECLACGYTAGASDYGTPTERVEMAIRRELYAAGITVPMEAVTR